MSDICLNCHGLIMEPNVAYGYAGKVCFCPIDPKKRYQRPSLNEKNKSIQSNKTTPPVSDERAAGVKWLIEQLSSQVKLLRYIENGRIIYKVSDIEDLPSWLEQQAKESGIIK